MNMKISRSYAELRIRVINKDVDDRHSYERA